MAAVALSERLLPESHGPRERLDLIGVGLITGGVVAIVWALVRATIRVASPEIVTTLSAGAVLLVAFLAWEYRVSRRWSRCGCSAAARSRSQRHDLPHVGGDLRGRLPGGRGIPVRPRFLAGVDRPRLLPFFGVPMMISPLAGALSDKSGRRPVMVAGLALLTAASPGLLSGLAGDSCVDPRSAARLGTASDGAPHCANRSP